jgi:BirA family biotin operon repressor/biotin-[acetyl-CoA-carboxylase] ligase
MRIKQFIYTLSLLIVFSAPVLAMAEDEGQSINRTHYGTVSSTRSLAKGISTSSQGWELITADSQTRGKERSERPWFSPPCENIYGAYRLPWPKGQLQKALHLTQVAAVSLLRTLEDFGLSPKFKWPNDIIVDDKKISGIGALSCPFDFEGIILLVGLNVNMDQRLCGMIDQPATSMAISLGKNLNREEVLKKFNSYLYKDIIKLQKEEYFPFFHSYLAERMVYLDTEVAIKDRGKITIGVVKGIDKFGLLRLTVNSVDETIVTGSLFKNKEDAENDERDKTEKVEDVFPEEVAGKIREKIPPHIDQSKSTQKGMGVRWGSKHGQDLIRIDKGNPDADTPHEKVDHVRVNSGGRVIGKDGKAILDSKVPLPRKAPEAHIPLSEWLQWKHWNMP